MGDLIRDTAFGNIVRFVSRNRWLQYPEEREDFVIPDAYLNPLYDKEVELTKENEPDDSAAQSETGSMDEKADMPDVERVPTINLASIEHNIHNLADLERAITAELKKEPTRPIVPQRTSDGIVLVDWYTTDDPANPQNWSLLKKNFVSFQICLYTFAVYMGSSIYTPSEGAIIEIFGVSATAASLGLALYVLGYGTGPLLFSPLSEIPVIGRNLPYIVTFGLFVILCIPAALVDNFAGLMVLRFLQGFFGSPCLATGGASFGDMYTLLGLPFLMSFWVAAATCGPALGPIISGFSVAAESWRWSLWELLWVAGPVFIVLFFFLPETSANNILLRRAARLRKVCGKKNFNTQSEIDQKQKTATVILKEALLVPAQIVVQDPAIAFATLYTALIYGIYYSYFESFPLVYIDLYGFNLGEFGLAFLALAVAIAVDIPIYFSYIHYRVNPKIRSQGLGAPEERLLPALVATWLPPIGLFIFGWTGNGSVHWIVSIIGVFIFTSGVFILIQSIFIYIPLSYGPYTASLFAANDFARSLVAAAAILFARPLFINLGVGRGISLLAGFTVGCSFGVYALWYFGAKLRARSKFAMK